MEVTEQLRGQLVLITYEMDLVKAMRKVALWLAKHQEEYHMLLPQLTAEVPDGFGYKFRINWAKII